MIILGDEIVPYENICFISTIDEIERQIQLYCFFIMLNY
jgi:hypothetical protein